MKKSAYYILAFSILFLLNDELFSQQWDNPSEKYSSSYKEYLSATCPVIEDNIKHFVYFSRDRESLIDHPLLTHGRFSGAQIMYSWRDLEPEQGTYDFSAIEEDVNYLSRHGKKLFIQLQDASFMVSNKPVPDYLTTNEYDSGVIIHYENDKAAGWITKRWNKKVRERFHLLLQELGKQFDDVIEGINLQETSLDLRKDQKSGFTEEGYIEGLKANMLALKRAFPTSTTMIYANFLPGEWLPWEDKGYLKGIYAYGEEIGVGLGAPDLMVTRKGQLNHALAQMHENDLTVPVGIAVQDGNYIGKTGADSDYDEHSDTGARRTNKVPLLHAFAKDFLEVDYMFWVNQKPYFEEDVLSCFSTDLDEK